MGDVVCRDIAGSGIDVIASRDMLRPDMDAVHHR
jgi:CxxC motif-containing protein